jgi:AraC-like DNA-binding protein
MQQRIGYARKLLRAGQPIIEVALEAGFADQAHFTKAFVRFMGMTPGQFRRVNF